MSARGTHIAATMAALLIAVPLHAQDSLVIRGRVVDQAGRPVESVALTLTPGLRRSTSLDAGQFEIRGLRTGTSAIAARGIGYQAASLDVFARDSVRMVTVTLLSVLRDLDSVRTSESVSGLRYSPLAHADTLPSPDTSRSITGTVFDSIAQRPLVGARVHVADLDRDTVTDSLGAFRFDRVGTGIHGVWVDHPALDSLGLYSLGKRVDAAAPGISRVALAIPSFATLWKLACGSGATPRGDSAFVFGRVTVRDSAASASDAVVEAQWQASAPGGGAVAGTSVHRTARPDSIGNYAVCGVPRGRVVTVSVHDTLTAAIPESFEIGDEGVARRDLTLPPVDRLEQLVTKLRTITIQERRRYDARKDDLDQRRRAGFGYRADSSDFARVMSVGQALSFPGVHVTTSGSQWGVYMTGVYSVPSKGGSGITMTCVPTVWIDGMISDWPMVNELGKDEIAMIEIYNSAARTPLQFAGTRTNCGVVLVWRKEYVNP